MRKSVVEMASVAALLLVGVLACGQEATPAASDPPATFTEKAKDAPAKSKLEEMLEKALRDNPDLRLAAAKVAEADAELNRARLLVVQKVGAAYQAVEAQKAAVEFAAAELAEVKTHHDAGTMTEATLRAAQGKLIDAKAKLAALEAEMPYLLGKQPANSTAAALAGMMSGGGAIGAGGLNPGGGLGQLGGGVGALGGSYIGGVSGSGFSQLGGGLGALGGGGPIDPNIDGDGIKPVPVLGKNAERIRAALDKPFSFNRKEAKLSTVVAEVSAAFQKANPGLLIKCNITQDQLDSQGAQDVLFVEMPFGAVLVWIEDSCTSAVVVRDYGLVIAPMTELPPGAPSLHDFWKGAKGENKAPAKDESLNSPSDPGVSGLVDKVASTGLVKLNLGSDIGIVKGNILEVIRLDKDHTLPWSKHKYLGRVRVVKVNAKESVAEPVDKMLEPLRTGDWVTTTQIYSD
jgi:hypothetical protein